MILRAYSLYTGNAMRKHMTTLYSGSPQTLNLQYEILYASEIVNTQSNNVAYEV